MAQIPATQTWTDGEIVTASDMETYINNPLKGLSGRLGVVELENSVILISGDGRTLRLPSGTTAQRPASPKVGMIRYNTTDHSIEWYAGTTGNEAWVRPLTTAQVTFETLSDNGDIGTGAAQLAEGDHTHNLQTGTTKDFSLPTTNVTAGVWKTWGTTSLTLGTGSTKATQVGMFPPLVAGTSVRYSLDGGTTWHPSANGISLAGTDRVSLFPVPSNAGSSATLTVAIRAGYTGTRPSVSGFTVIPLRLTPA